MLGGKYADELKKYIGIGNIYLLKSFIIKTLLFCVSIVMLIVMLVIPLYHKYFGMLYEGSERLAVFSGYGKVYGEDSNLLYEGDILKGVYSGNGTLYRDNTIIYEGEFRQGQYNGLGRLYEEDNLIYAGEFNAGIFDGFGRLYETGLLLYEGYFVEGSYYGHGVLYDKLGRIVYTGTYIAGKKNGFGQLYAEDGNLLYNGLFLDDEIDYFSLLGRHYNEIKSVFPVRSYFSFGPINDECPGELLKQYYCICYKGIKSAVIFSVKDGQPDYAEAVIVWDGGKPVNDILDAVNEHTALTDINNLFANKDELPAWIHVFYDNEMCPVIITEPDRLIIEDYREPYELCYWFIPGESGASFYSITYIDD